MMPGYAHGVYQTTPMVVGCPLHQTTATWVWYGGVMVLDSRSAMPLPYPGQLICHKLTPVACRDLTPWASRTTHLLWLNTCFMSVGSVTCTPAVSRVGVRWVVLEVIIMRGDLYSPPCMMMTHKASDVREAHGASMWQQRWQPSPTHPYYTSCRI